MSALFIMRFLGATGAGFGAIYVGNGRILGVDAGNLRYSGSYTEQGGRLKANVVLTSPSGGVLVTGQQMPAGAKLSAAADWPANFANGQPQQITINGQQVSVTFEKVGDVP